jgi:beta-1,4-mannosyl-glycoprotein beta-1,4-N-acetylglucosaminyltransferase
MDMLSYRLNSLNDVVDYFIIVESKYTFSGHEKQLYFNDNKELFKDINYKIIHVVLNDAPFKYPNVNYSKNEQWQNEHFNRNGIKNGIDQLQLNDKDILIISDLDEIPDINLLRSIKNNNLVINDIFSLNQDFYYYNLNSKMNQIWNLSKILSFKTYKKLNKTCKEIREHHCNSINKGGWHLSYFGDKHFIKNKIENFSHQEFNNDNFTNIDKINQRLENMSDVFDREYYEPHNKAIVVSVKDNDRLPLEYEKYLQKFIVF